ncbi:MAG: hypothetical protein H6673_05700 [Anaerolineales bacterium]|nr:hypothetical protein [Anaerolineales bacterium]
MNNIDKILRDAEAAFEENRFVEANKGFRQAALLQPDSVLTNLVLSHKFDLLHFVRSVIKEHPSSFDARLTEIYLMIEWSFSTRYVVEKCSLLLKENLSLDNETRVRLARLSATLEHASDFEEACIEDFMAIWTANTHKIRNRGQRERLLHMITATSKSDVIQLLERLAQDNEFSSHIREFFESKIRELQSMDKAIKFSLE